LSYTSPDPLWQHVAKDAGAVGVLAPYIEKYRGRIQQMVGQTKYRPLKGDDYQNVLLVRGIIS